MNNLCKYIPSILITLIMAVPILFVLSFSFNVDPSVWGKLWQHRIPSLTFNSLLLVLTVTIGAVIIGTPLAFLVERTDLPFLKVIKPLLIAPIITPCYIIAIC